MNSSVAGGAGCGSPPPEGGPPEPPAVSGGSKGPGVALDGMNGPPAPEVSSTSGGSESSGDSGLLVSSFVGMLFSDIKGLSVNLFMYYVQTTQFISRPVPDSSCYSSNGQTPVDRLQRTRQTRAGRAQGKEHAGRRHRGRQW